MVAKYSGSGRIGWSRTSLVCGRPPRDAIDCDNLGRVIDLVEYAEIASGRAVTLEVAGQLPAARRPRVLRERVQSAADLGVFLRAQRVPGLCCVSLYGDLA
jgi:hypothetical protein